MRVYLGVPEAVTIPQLQQIVVRLIMSGNVIYNPTGKMRPGWVGWADTLYIIRAEGWEKEFKEELAEAKKNNMLIMFEE